MNTHAMQQWWAQRPPREQTLLRTAAWLLLAALLWALAVAPALRTLRAFETQYARQQAQLQSMRGMQAQAQALQSQPRLSQASASQALQTTVQQAFGSQAELALQGGNATVTLRGVSAEALAQWLASARAEARATPVQARLERSAKGWSGTLLMGLPAP